MLRSLIEEKTGFYDPATRGYGPIYRRDEPNHCPSCGRTHWHIGRFSAECAFCATALPLQERGAWSSGSSFLPRR